jgi:hypothetical protein
VRDAQQKGGAEYAYRLRIGPPRPDFELRLVPSGLGARAGSTVPITVYALRRDGFSGDIALELKDAPSGFSLSGGWVPAHQDRVRLTLTVPPLGREEPYKLLLEGRAVIQGGEIRRAARPAEEMMQAFAYHHLVPSEEWLVFVSGRARFGAALRLREDAPVKLPAGGTARVHLAGPGSLAVSRLQLALSDPPEGIDIQSVSAEGGGVVIVLHAETGKVKAGLKGNLMVDAFTEVRLAGVAGAPGGGRRRVPVVTLPAIPFEIVAP